MPTILRLHTGRRLGAQGVDANTSGTLYFDDLESRRFSYIGTLTDPGVDDPQASNPAGWTASTYSYSASIPHAVTSVAIENGGTNSYEYDANGNLTCRIENGVVYTHTYNAENRASSIAKRNTNCTGTIIESWSFAYDGDGVRVMTAHFTGTSGTPDSTTSYYMGGAYEVKDGAVKKYYAIAGMMVAVKDGTGLQYLLTDHLGSTVAVTNSSGTLTSQQRYLPFGGARSIPNSPIAGTDFTYTGQRILDSGMGGIMDYKARFYSPYINRFLQPDSIIPNPVNPQAFNRFSYVFNNPVQYVDPSGNVPIDCYGDPGYCSTDDLPDPYVPPDLEDDEDENETAPEEELQEDDEFFDWDGSRGCYDFSNNRYGCARYYSVAIGLDAPTIMVLLGLGLSIAKLPNVGLPIALAGLVFEKCAFTGSPLCAAVKLTSLNISATIDSYGNLYVGPQISLGKSLLPVVAFSNNIGAIYSNSQESPTEAEVRDHLTGTSVSVGTIATGGINYSPFATTYNTSYYTVGIPELFSANFNLYNFRVFDFIP